MSFQIDPLISDLLVYASQRSDSSGTTGSVRNGFYRLLLFIASMFINHRKKICWETVVAVISLVRISFDFLISDFDFLEDPLFITSGAGDATNEELKMSEQEQNSLKEFFQENRKGIFKSFGMIISSAVDKKKSLLSKNGPSFGIIKRMQMLAKASYQKVIWIF